MEIVQRPDSPMIEDGDFIEEEMKQLAFPEFFFVFLLKFSKFSLLINKKYYLT